MKKHFRIYALVLALVMAVSLAGCGSTDIEEKKTDTPVVQEEVQKEEPQDEPAASEPSKPQGSDVVKKVPVIGIDEVPAYSGSPFVVINNNIPAFSSEDMITTGFEEYSDQDSLGRCGVAYANVCIETMPTEKRGSIGSVKPAGWHTVKYDHVDGKYLYNRCHLIGFQLTAENANRRNLITGTRYFNVEGMLPFENMIADYVKETGNHVLYRVTPVYDGNDLLAQGVQMEAYSIEDEGDGICFNVFVYNVQPGVVIDYATGNSYQEGETISSDVVAEENVIRGNKRSKIYHCPGQRDYAEMADSKNLVIFKTEKEAVDAGYRRAKQ